MNVTRALTTKETIEEAQTFHANCVRAGVPVLAWEDFERLACELGAADTDFRSAIMEVDAAINRIVPVEEQYVGWQRHAPEAAVQLADLLSSDDLPYLHRDDFRFRLDHGKARRNPAAHMEKKARELRRHAARLRKRLAELTR
jgi:hypothetical protein